MRHWNYRVVGEEGGAFAIFEVHYDDGKIEAWVDEPVELSNWETRLELEGTVKLVMLAFVRPTLKFVEDASGNTRLVSEDPAENPRDQS